MADLLTHVLVAFVLAVILSERCDWLTPQLATVAMAGAIVPDLSRMELVVPAASIESTTGLPFSWEPFHRLGGAALVVAIGALTVPPRYRRRVALLLALGVASHFALDLLTFKPSGASRPFLWPLTDYRFTNRGFYRSSDRWPALVAAFVAASVWALSRRRAVIRRTLSPRDP